MSDLDILKMELEQLKKEVDTPRSAVSQVDKADDDGKRKPPSFISFPLISIMCSVYE